jgi:hypothetical protein
VRILERPVKRIFMVTYTLEIYDEDSIRPGDWIDENQIRRLSCFGNARRQMADRSQASLVLPRV